MNRFEQIYPDDFVEAVKEIGQAFTRNQWAIGDRAIEARLKLTNKKTDIITGNFDGPESDALMILAYTQGQLKSDLARAFGISQSRLYQIIDIVKFFSQFKGSRDKYQILPFAHFEFARSQGEKYALSVLDFDLKQTERGQGSPPSVEWLYQNFMKRKIDDALADHQAVDDFDQAAVSFISQPQKQNDDDDENDGLPLPIFYFLTTARGLIDSVSKSVDGFEIDDVLRAEISRVLDDLLDLSERIETSFKM